MKPSGCPPTGFDPNFESRSRFASFISDLPVAFSLWRGRDLKHTALESSFATLPGT